MRNYVIETIKKCSEFKPCKNEAHWKRIKTLARRNGYEAYLWNEEMNKIIDAVY